MPTRELMVALDALARWRSAEPEHAQWVGQGAPRLTEREHRSRFGRDYADTRPKRAKR